MKEKCIQFEVCFGSKTYAFNVSRYEYRSLMHLITDRIYIEEFGQCGGMGRCGTCIVLFREEHGGELHRNEQTTLRKLQFDAAAHNRLACQIMIDEAIHGCTFRIETADQLV